MKTQIITTLLTAVFLVTATLPANAQSTEQLFQKGVMKEEGEGNLPEAIEIFNSIVEDSEADDALQAKALLHVGLCYEKLGKKEATKAYQKLVDNFPAQKNEVAIARKRLSRLILEAEKIAKKNVLEKTYALTNRKVWDESETYLTGHISPDGKYLSYVDWDTGDLALYEITTGKKRRLTNKGTWEESDAFAEYSVWLPDSKQIVYLWMNEENKAEIRTIKIGDTTPRTLFTNNEMNWAEIYDCSQDGKYVLLCFNRKDNNGELITISTIDGSKETLRLFKSTWTHSAAFSSDGRFIVYDLPQENEAGNKDIYIMNLETKNESVLINHPEDDRVMGWLPDRNDLLFISDRTGTPDFWRIKLEHGRSVGTAELVKSNKGPFPPLSLGFTDNGIFYYGERRNRVDVYEMEIDPLSGNIIEQPRKIVEKYIGCNVTPDHSEDGKFLAYVSRRPPGTMRFTTNPVGNVLCIRSLETGKEKEFRPDLNVFGFPKWAPDGQSVMVVNFDQKGNLEYYQIDTNTGKAKPVLLNTGRNLFGGHYFSDNGKILYHGIRDEKTKKYKLVARDLTKNKEIVLYEDDNHFTLAVSPDKQSIAILSEADKSLKILPVKGGDPKELFNSEQAKDLRPETRSNMFTWSSDGKSIYFADQLSNEEGNGRQLYRISVKSENITSPGLKSEGYFMSLNAHPDGRHFVYSARGKSNSEVWMMEYFLPPENLAQNNTSEKEPEGIAIKQVWKGPEADICGKVSSDGTILSYVDWETGNLALRNLTTSKNELLTKDATWEDPMHFALNNILSPNEEKVVYSWYNNKGGYDLRLMDLKVRNPVTLFEGGEFDELYPVCWGTEKDEVIIQKFIKEKNNKYKWDLCVFNLTDKSFKSLCEFNKPFMANVSCSHNQKYLGYDFQVSSDNGKYDIAAVSPNDGHIESLVTHPGNDRVLGWMPGENNFLFISDRSGTYDLYSVETSNGKPINEPIRLLKGIGEISPMGFSDNGTLFYNIHYRNFNTFITEHDEEEKINPENRISLLGSLLDPCWLPDGKTLICLEYTMQSHDFELCLYNTKTNQINPLIKNRDINVYGPPSLSPDGKKLLVFGLDREKMENQEYIASIYSVDIDNGIATAIKKFEEYHPGIVEVCEWDKLGDNIFYVEDNKIIQRNIETGKESTVYQGDENDIFGILKRYNNTLIFDAQVGEEEKHIKSVSVHDGQVKTICKLNTSGTPLIFKKVAFPVKGNYFIVSVDGQKDGSVLYKISLENGKPERIWQSKNRIAGLSIHPNNDKIAISLLERHMEIRKIENLKQEIEKIYTEKTESF